MKWKKFEDDKIRFFASRPARGAWIEITSVTRCKDCKQSRPARGAWIEIQNRSPGNRREMSRPARGAWIEIAGMYGAR